VASIRPGGVLCCGNIVFDILVRPVDELRWSSTTWVESIEQHIGGNGANTSFSLARLGVPVRLLSVVGSDATGGQLCSILSEAGVDTQYIEKCCEPTATSVVLVKSDGTRLFLHRPGSSGVAFPDPIRFTPGLTGGLPHFHLANVFALPKLRGHAGETLRCAREAGLTTSLDTGWDSRGQWMEVLRPCLHHLDMLFVNEDEARMLSGCSGVAEAAAVFRAEGAGTVVVKLGGAGCAVFDDSGEIRAPGIEVPVVDTTGAGDSFAGGFLAALHYGKHLADAARFANAVGALSVQGLGSVRGLRDLAGTEEFLSSLK
jgi:sugar/nucleoside kinase (ribokinase family)